MSSDAGILFEQMMAEIEHVYYFGDDDKKTQGQMLKGILSIINHYNSIANPPKEPKTCKCCKQIIKQ